MNIFILFLLILIPTEALATTKPELVDTEARIEEKLDTFIDLDLEFTTQDGEKKTIRELTNRNRPFIITPVYYQCPRLCTYIINGFVEVANKLKLEIGKDFNVLSISFNHKESSKLTSTKYKNYLKIIDNKEAAKAGWTFLTGDEKNVSTIMDQLGFHFKEDKGEFIHSAALMVITPEGKIARYFYGIKFNPEDLEFALVEASQGRIGSTIHKVLLFCFRFDPTKGQYTLSILKITNIICVLFVIIFSIWLFLLHRRTSKARKTPNVGDESLNTTDD